MARSFFIKPVGEIYELTLTVVNDDGTCTMETTKFDLKNSTLEEAIKSTIACYYFPLEASLFKVSVFEDEKRNKYFSEREFVKNII